MTGFAGPLKTILDKRAALDKAKRQLSGLMKIPRKTTIQQMAMLQLLGEGGVPLGKAAERLSCARSNVTQIADCLERDGLIIRRRRSEDRRIVLIELTAAGQTLLSQIEAQLESAISQS